MNGEQPGRFRRYFELALSLAILLVFVIGGFELVRMWKEIKIMQDKFDQEMVRKREGRKRRAKDLPYDELLKQKKLEQESPKKDGK